MPFEVKIIADSVNPCGKRLTTITATYPRFIHSEILTHRDRARNSASSRAIPFPKMLAQVVNEPVIPIYWGMEQKGMQTGQEISPADVQAARQHWLKARDSAVAAAEQLHQLGVHKSICNRLVEPFMWITVVMTATEWANFFRLRCHPDAEIHFQRIAGMIRDALAQNTPQFLNEGEWHLPFIQDDERDLHPETLKRVSVARCARVSYLTHEGKRSIEDDLQLFERLVQGSGFGHWSAHEHVACASGTVLQSGPFCGWLQYRKSFRGENLPG